MPKVKKKRMSFVVDMTPLVDITFLLLTFLMFTATFKADTENNALKVERPKAAADTTFLPEKDLAVVTVGLNPTNKADTIMTFGLSNSKTRALVREMVPGIPENFQQTAIMPVKDSAQMVTLLKAASSASEKTVFAIDGDKAVFFKKIQEIMEMFRVSHIRSFNYVTDKQRNQE